MSEINIYVADLAAYNNGILHGIWIDATLDISDIWDAVNAMLKASPIEDSEEFAIHDYEGFGSYRLGEYEGLESAHNIACFIEKYPDFGDELLAYYQDINEAERIAEDGYVGCYHSVADYAESITEDIGDIPPHLHYYIDYERMGRDMELSGDIFTIEKSYDEVHIFLNH